MVRVWVVQLLAVTCGVSARLYRSSHIAPNVKHSLKKSHGFEEDSSDQGVLEPYPFGKPELTSTCAEFSEDPSRIHDSHAHRPGSSSSTSVSVLLEDVPVYSRSVLCFCSKCNNPHSYLVLQSAFRNLWIYLIKFRFGRGRARALHLDPDRTSPPQSHVHTRFVLFSIPRHGSCRQGQFFVGDVVWHAVRLGKQSLRPKR